MGLVLLLPLDTGQNSEDVSLYKEAPNEVFLFGPVARGENYSSSGSRRKRKRSPLTGQWVPALQVGPLPGRVAATAGLKVLKRTQNARAPAGAEAKGEVLPPHWTKAQLCLNPTESGFVGALGNPKAPVVTGSFSCLGKFSLS